MTSLTEFFAQHTGLADVTLDCLEVTPPLIRIRRYISVPTNVRGISCPGGTILDDPALVRQALGTAKTISGSNVVLPVWDEPTGKYIDANAVPRDTYRVIWPAINSTPEAYAEFSFTKRRDDGEPSADYNLQSGVCSTTASSSAVPSLKQSNVSAARVGVSQAGFTVSDIEVSLVVNEIYSSGLDIHPLAPYVLLPAEYAAHDLIPSEPPLVAKAFFVEGVPVIMPVEWTFGSAWRQVGDNHFVSLETVPYALGSTRVPKYGLKIVPKVAVVSEARTEKFLIHVTRGNIAEYVPVTLERERNWPAPLTTEEV